MPGVSRFDISFSEDYINDGQLNDFPQYLAKIAYQSPTTTAALGRIKDFVIGSNINPALKDVKVNKEGMTFAEFHARVASDFAYLRRIAIKIKPLAGGMIDEVSPIPVEWVRWGEPDDEFNTHNCVVNPFLNTTFQREQRQVLPLWKGDDTKKRNDVKQLGKKDYKGHIYFYNITSERNRIYSRPDYFSAEQFINVDYKSGLYYDRFTDNNFFGGCIVNVYGDPDQGIVNADGDVFTTVGEEFAENLSNTMAGSDKSGGAMFNWLGADDKPTTIEAFPTGQSHEVFDSINQITEDKICQSMGVPKILLPQSYSGSRLGGDTQEMRNAILFLNERTEKLRQILEETYRKIFADMPTVNIPEDEPIIIPMGVFTDLPDNVFNALKADQRESYLQRQFGIEPSELKEETPIEIPEPINNKLNGLYNTVH